MFVNLTTSLWSSILALNLAITGTGPLLNNSHSEAPVTSQEVYTTLHEDTGTQTLTVASDASPGPLTRDDYTVKAPPPPPPPVITASTQSEKFTPPPNIKPDPGTAKEEAWNQLQERGWDQSEFNCLVALWSKESGWRVNASNTTSGAYGIPQALPGTKMSTAGDDWQTNPATQIKWGLNYIAGKYTTPCQAWQHSETYNWY